MNVWLLQTGEPLPIDPTPDRRMRMALLADALRARGHRILWWSATFDHVRKRHRFGTDTRVPVSSGFDLMLMHSPGYARNVSFARLRDHAILAKAFPALAARETRPDVLVIGFPPVGLAAAAVRYAVDARVPSLVDVRDLWPDAMIGIAPRAIRPIVRAGLRPMRRAAEFAMAQATARIAVSDTYLRWAVVAGGGTRRPGDRVVPLAHPRAHVTRDELDAAGRAVRARGVDPERWIVWFIGTFGRTYDLSTPIAAARKLAEVGMDDVQLVFSGDGDYAARWRTEAAGLANVVFTGWIDTAAIAYLGSVARVGLAAYAEDAPQSLPNKLFEYLAAGLPVVSSLEGEAAELLERRACGSNYRAGDPASLVAALRTLRDDPVRRDRMGANAAAAAEQFSGENVIREYAAHVEAVAAGAPDA